MAIPKYWLYNPIQLLSMAYMVDGYCQDQMISWEFRTDLQRSNSLAKLVSTTLIFTSDTIKISLNRQKDLPWSEKTWFISKLRGFPIGTWWCLLLPTNAGSFASQRAFNCGFPRKRDL
jgi:hypothetical protein